jgi:hypothetical protein
VKKRQRKRERGKHKKWKNPKKKSGIKARRRKKENIESHKH